MTQENNDIIVRRRRVSFRAWHRGTREMDFILGAYADQNIETMNDAALDELEELMEIDDQTLYRWVSGALKVPEEFDTALMAALKALRFSQGKFA